MKRIILLALCLMLLIAVTAPASAEGSVHLSISTDSHEVYRGDSITFYISASGNGSCESFGVLLSYNSAVFEFVGGSASVSGAVVSSMSSSGLVASYNGIGTPSGIVGSFTLRVRSDAPFGTANVSGNANANGASVSASGTSVKICCHHSYGDWAEIDDNNHQRTCPTCSGKETAPHTWGNGVVTVTPECNQLGEKTYTCSVCQGTKTEDLPKPDHTYGQWEKVDDSTHKHTCTVCQNPETKAHTWDNGKVTKTPNCKEEGEKTYTCTGCKATKVEKLDKTTDHTYGQWEKVDDSTHKHTCTVCQNPETKAHTWDNGKVTDQPNCQKEGEKTYTCTGCKATKVEKLGITDHAFTNVCDPDCNTAGCDFTRTITHKYSSKWSSNASQHYHACTVCGDKKDAADHKQSDWIVDKAAEPLKAGSKHIECTVCKATLKTASIPALDCPHEGEPNVKDAREATCLEAGYTGDKICALCETVLEEGTEIAPLGHDGKLANDKEVTCQEAGYTGDEVCSRCNVTLKQGQALDIVGHNYADGVCTMCGAEEPKPVNVVLIIIIVAGVAVVAAAAVVFLKKRK